jgi:clan AA aspartic protease (TIGR02281 family)
MSISESMAQKLGIDTDQLADRQIIVADGRKVDVKSTTLKSVRLGEAYAKDVPAVVIPTPTETGPDGLLGMSFLRNFVMRFDAATGNLVLRRFEPEQP